VLLVAAQSKHQNSGFYDDIERFRAQLQHFLFVYGWSAGELSRHLTHDPARAYDYLRGKCLPTRATRQRWCPFMRDYSRPLSKRHTTLATVTSSWPASSRPAALSGSMGVSHRAARAEFRDLCLNVSWPDARNGLSPVSLGFLSCLVSNLPTGQPQP